MNSFLNYLIEANICLIAFIILYFLVLKNETNFRFNRIYLLASISFSVMFPIFHIEGASGNTLLPSIGNAIPIYWLPEYVFNASEKTMSASSLNFSIWNAVLLMYFAGVVFFSLLLIFRLSRLFILIKKLPKYTWNKCKVAKTTSNLPTFSFFSFIHIGKSLKLSEAEENEILRHEYAHVQNFHSIDIILINLIEIIFWFNPIIRSYKKIITQLHEFEADARAVENHDLGVYCNLLARVALQSADFSIANHFNKSLTLKRITMMTINKRKIKAWKIAAIALAIPSTFIFVACQDQVMEDVSEVIESSSMAVEIPAEVQLELDKLKAANPNGNFNVIQMDDNGMQKLEDLEKKWGSKPTSMHVFKASTLESNNSNSKGGVSIMENNSEKDGNSFVILEFNDQVNRIIESDASKHPNEIFTVVEEQPQPEGGMESFYGFIGENMQYPAEAVEKRIEGKVYVEFIVNKNGSLENIKALKGIGGGCDEEAVRVISMSNNWKPGLQRGRPVDVKMVLPITFALN